MQSEWRMLLEAESTEAAGALVTPLSFLHWRQNQVVRLLYLSNDLAQSSTSSSSVSTVLHLLRLCVSHIGDTVVIENSHQQAKDCLRDARHNSRSRISKQHAVVTCNSLTSRGLKTIEVSAAEPGLILIHIFVRFVYLKRKIM